MHKTLKSPSTSIAGRTVIVKGQWIKTAVVMDEELMEGELVQDPELFVAGLKQVRLKADIFSFTQRPPDVTPKYNYFHYMDNWAVIPITTYNEWWENRLPQEARKNVRRAGRRGVVVKLLDFNDDLVKGIREIYNETPFRQGRRFNHYGKDFDTVKRENGTYLERSQFLGAYSNEELVGFIKITYADHMAMLMQIIGKNAHHDKRPVNALLARAVELCVQRGASYLVYDRYVYDGNEDSALTEFKRRNGFEEIKFPRYFLPLTAKGKMAISLGLQSGVRSAIPAPLMRAALKLRARYNRAREASKQCKIDTTDSVVSDHQA